MIRYTFADAGNARVLHRDAAAQLELFYRATDELRGLQGFVPAKLRHDALALMARFEQEQRLLNGMDTARASKLFALRNPGIAAIAFATVLPREAEERAFGHLVEFVTDVPEAEGTRRWGT